MGRAARWGFITPSSNTALEPGVTTLTAGRGTAHFTRIPVGHIGVDPESDGQFDAAEIERAAVLLADARVDVVVWAGTSGTWLGIERERALSARLSAAAGVPATTSTLALLAACDAYGVHRLGLVTPYTAEVCSRIVAELGGAGIEVVTERHLGLATNFDFAAVTDETLRPMIDAAGRDADGVAVVCTNVDAVRAATWGEARLGVPVLDSVAATVWHALSLAGDDDGVVGHGDLLANGTSRARMRAVTDRLLTETGADRATLRIDLPAAGCSVATCAAEACRPGVRSIRRDASLPQRDLATVRWLDAHRVPLVQPDFAHDPRPPDALLEVYGVRAQLLAPVVRDGAMVAWLSVHSLTERGWTDGDQRAARAAAHEVGVLLDTRYPGRAHDPGTHRVTSGHAEELV